MARGNGAREEFRRVRGELGVTQTEMACVLGLSEKAVQSYEQGWRNPPESVHRLLNVVYTSHRIRKRGRAIVCWVERDCPPSVRKNCRAFQMRQGHLCWLLRGSTCRHKDADADGKNRECQKCKVYRWLGLGRG